MSTVIFSALDDHTIFKKRRVNMVGFLLDLCFKILHGIFYDPRNEICRFFPYG